MSLLATCRVVLTCDICGVSIEYEAPPEKEPCSECDCIGFTHTMPDGWIDVTVRTPASDGGNPRHAGEVCPACGEDGRLMLVVKVTSAPEWWVPR